MPEQHGGSYASPFDHSTDPEEPPRGAVLAYQRLGHGGATLDYVSFRAGDGRWYTTGKNSAQGVDWQTLWAAVRMHASGPVMYATAWQPLEVHYPPLPPSTPNAFAPLSPTYRDEYSVRRGGPLASAETGDAGPIGGAL